MRQLLEVHSRAPKFSKRFEMHPDWRFCLSMRDIHYKSRIVCSEAILHAAAPKKHVALRDLRVLNRFMDRTS
jgi:hypothetical protein